MAVLEACLEAGANAAAEAMREAAIAIFMLTTFRFEKVFTLK
jgi:hypothetical protein